MKKSLRERKARPLHFNVINSHCATRLSQKILFCCSLLSLCDCFIGSLCQRIFFFSFVCWLLNFLRFIKGTNKTDSSLHSMKSVSLILLFYFFFSIVSCTKQQWALFKQCVANDELWTRMTHQEKRSLCLSIYLYCGQVSLTKYHLHDPSQHGRLL